MAKFQILNTLRVRFLLAFIFIVLISVGGVVLIARQGAASEVRSFITTGNMMRMTGVTQVLEDYYKSNQTWEGVASVFDQSGHGMGNQGGSGMMNGTMNQELLLADASGQVIYNSIPADSTDQLSEEERSRAVPLYQGSETIGYLLSSNAIRLSASEESFLVSRLGRAAWIAGLIAGGIALLVALFLAYRLQQPVHELTIAARRLADGDLAQRVPVRGQDELTTLAHSFNLMADSLQNARISRRAMTADIAHELRTPLAVQRANLEALQDEVYPLTKANLLPILEQNQLLTRLVEDLQILTMVDSGQLKLEVIPSDFVLLLERLAAHFHPQAEKQGVGILLQFPSEALPLVLADTQRIEQILSNLISNALRYTPAGGKIEITLGREAEMVTVQVHDSGPGIPKEALAMVFERFYRADKSRSRVEGGSGLGLAIARQLAQAHGGDLTAANHPLGGAVLTLSLPINHAGQG